ncbi:MAG: tail fiber domain-containing protein [Pyrinomonadaceae bacterium]
MLKLSGILVRRIAPALLIFLLSAGIIRAQSSSFTYQGKLVDNNSAANGTYEMEFSLFDSAVGGNQISTTNSISNVTVSNGIFTVRLTFGILAFDGNPRFLEIGVRPAGSPNPFTVLAPRQSVLSTPYAVRSLFAGTADLAADSNQLGGIDAGQYVQTNDSRLSDARNPLPGSANYIQNTTLQQSASNFNVSGNGTLGGTLSANAVNSATQFNIAGSRVLGIGGSNNIFAGTGAGTNNTTGNGNAFFGRLAGTNNTTGINNAFFGFNAGSANNGGGANTFIGVNAGTANVGSSNNTFIGANAGNTNLTSNGNTYLGANSDGGLLVTNSVSIGQKAYVGQSNALVLGSINGVNGATASTDIGIGTSTPSTRLHIKDDNNSGNIAVLIESSFVGGTGIELRNTASGGKDWFIYSNNGSSSCCTLHFVNSTAGEVFGLGTGGGSNGNGFAVVNGDFTAAGTVSVGLMTNGQNTSVCWNSVNKFLGTCSSSIRYKTDLRPFTGGLSLVNQLNPFSFRWKSDGSPDLGFVAEDVAAVEPLLATTNADGQVEGVKYDRISAVLVNAIKEQQAQIEQLQTRIEQQQKQIADLERQITVVKKSNPVRKTKSGRIRKRSNRRR